MKTIARLWVVWAELRWLFSRGESVLGSFWEFDRVDCVTATGVRGLMILVDCRFYCVADVVPEPGASSL